MEAQRVESDHSAGMRPILYRKLQVAYSKLGPARFFGHLELVNIIFRALRRAGIRLKYSEGFHPKPKVAFDNPLPTGMESEDERMVINVADGVAPATLLRRLNDQLPEGLYAHSCTDAILDRPNRCTFRISFGDNFPEELKSALNKIDFGLDLEIVSPKGKLKKIALRDILIDVRLTNSNSLDMTLECEPGKTVRATEVLKQAFGLTEKCLRTVGVRKLRPPAAIK
jgi:radical SAM-linked protein